MSELVKIENIQEKIFIKDGFEILKSHFATSSLGGKKWIAFSKMDKESLKILEKLREAKRLGNE